MSYEERLTSNLGVRGLPEPEIAEVLDEVRAHEAATGTAAEAEIRHSQGVCEAVPPNRRAARGGSTIAAISTALLWLKFCSWVDGSAEPLQAKQKESRELTTIRILARARQHLAKGITTIRDVGGPHEVILAVRQAIEEGVARGARVIAAGRPIVTTGGHAHEMGIVADGADEVRRAVRTMLAEHVDLIRVMAGGGVFPQGEHLDSIQLGVDELTAAVTEGLKQIWPLRALTCGT